MNLFYWKQSLDNASQDTILIYDHRKKNFNSPDTDMQRKAIIHKMTEDFYTVKDNTQYILKKNNINNNIIVQFSLNEYDSFQRPATSIFLIEEYDHNFFEYQYKGLLSSDDFLSKTSLTKNQINDLIKNLESIEKIKVKKKFFIFVFSILLILILFYLVA